MSKKPASDEMGTIGGKRRPPLVRANRRRTVVKAETFASIYTNDIQLQMTPWDLRLILGEISGLPDEDDDGALTVTQSAQVRMSPQMAKRMTMLLMKQLEHYESTFGKIPQPED